MPVTFDLNKCDGCGTCDVVCPGDVIYMHKPQNVESPDGSGGIVKITPQRLPYGVHLEKRSPYLPKPEECWHCGSCRQDCPTDAISVVFSPDMLCI
ncbi:MAG: 4Fe-4S dicluster domain-containing protein [Proteobacteria bacterium]|nr:MAG: 4Fe-4S dicluster domain-containing protein [Pseudomonadota bacterium]QKK11770.1 MAG: 4Fe-4S binding protein [Pseudomonadota bacterium]